MIMWPIHAENSLENFFNERNRPMNKSSPGKLINFPAKGKHAKIKKKKIRNLDGIKYFPEQQIKLLRRTVRDAAELDLQHRRATAIKEWAVIDLLTSTGLRVSEAANLKCGDLRIGYSESKIFINEGKCNVSGHVIIPEHFKKHLKQYLSWKTEQGEGTGEKDFLFIGQRGHWTSQAIQQIVKKYLRALNLYEKGKSVHSLRHSYATALYAKAKDLRAVQKQLRHVSIASTLVYADVTDKDIGEQIKGLWN